jgi:hypothetical protein
MRWTALTLLALTLTACRDKYSVGEATYDPSLLTSSGGEVALSDGSSFDFVITSDRYNQWDVARKAFSRSVSARFGDLLRPDAPTERTIQRSITYLEGQPEARAGIERAGMTVRDFVLMTVALEQQMRLATQRAERAEVTEAPIMTDTFATDTPRADSAYLPGDLGPRYPYTPLPVDTPRRVDTVFLPSPRDSMPRRDTLRPRLDTTRAARDTARPPRDTSSPPTPRDTNPPPRDTLPPAPPDSIGRT